MSFPGLDVVFRLAAPAVELLVQRSATAMAEVGDDEAGIGAVGTGLDAGDDAADPAPAAGGVMELLEAADLARGRRGLETAGGAFLEAADVALQGAGRGEAEDVVEAVRLAPVEHFRAGVVAVGADEDRHLRPVGPDRAHQAAEKSPDLAAARPFRRAQERSDEATILVEDDDRLETVVVVVGIEQAQLLAAVHRIEGVVIEDDALRHLPERAAVDIDQSPTKAQQCP